MKRLPFVRPLAAAAAVLLCAGGFAFFAARPVGAAAGCSVTYAVTNSWSTGFTVQGISVTNLGSPITSWTLSWTFPGNQQVTNGWNGTFTQSGQQVTVTSASYNGSLGTGASANPAPGFNGSSSGTNVDPTSFTLNGTLCTGSATPTPTPSTSPSGTPTPTPPPTPTPSGSPTPTPPPGTHVADPFTGATPFLDPEFTKQVQAQATADGSAAEGRVANFPTAYWLDTMCSIAGGGTCGRLGLQTELNDALQASSGPVTIEIVIYDLPGRDCAALASNGEIPATSAGLTTYETQYINPIAAILSQAKYASSNLRVVAIIEPDSLPNVVTNQSKSACATSTPFYESGITYALNQLHAVPNVYNYMDIAHSAWLGWPSNMSGTPAVYNSVVKATTAGYASIDGFISDTANYTPTQEPFLTNPNLSVGGQQLDSAKFYQFNPTFDELTYDTNMYNTLVSAGFPASKRFLIDTSRNGWGGPNRPTSLNSSPTTPDTYVAANKVDQRPFRGDWCNISGAGIGARPQDEPFGASSPVMAFVWIKPPGASDGDYPTSTHTHGDPHCDPNGTQTDGNGNTYPTDAIPGFDIPAGQWFPFEFQTLVQNALPAL